jgi:hypothetical protein
LRDLKQRGYTLAIIDTPGSDSDVVTEAIPLADLCLIPARPSQADIEAAYPTLKAIRSFDRKFAFVLNQAPVRGQRPTRAATALPPLFGQRSDCVTHFKRHVHRLKRRLLISWPCRAHSESVKPGYGLSLAQQPL